MKTMWSLYFIVLAVVLPIFLNGQDVPPTDPSFTPNALCEPLYSTGCSLGDGFTDFALAEIENYGSGCADLNGTGWSQYLGLGPAILLPGLSYDVVMQTGYADQFVTIWIDFDDDEELESDEIVLFDFHMEEPGQFYTATFTIPTDALPGMHYLRARTNWVNSCNDPCEEYSYGEAEDYFVLIGSSEAGAIEGYVTEYGNGDPVEGASISLTGSLNYTVSTGSDGYYLIEDVFTGDYALSCFKEGYNPQNTSVTIENELTLVENFALTHPEILVSPLTVQVTLPPGETGQEAATIENNGNGPLNWAASVQLSGKKSKDYLELQFEYPAAQGEGEAGIETDGNFLYTTKWNGSDILKYDPDGDFIESFSITGVSGLRDLAFDGTFFYGSAAIPVVWEMDFENKELLSSFTAPTSVRAIAWVDGEEVFYANNFSSPVIKFDKTGNNLGGFTVGPEGSDYYGFAYDPASVGGPFLWGYAQNGENENTLVQIQLPSGSETGFTLDVVPLLSGPFFNTAGGLFTHPNLVFGKWTLGGLVQNETMWGLDLGDAQTWVWLEPNIGTLEPGESQDLIVHFDATELEPGEYEAGIYFNSDPAVGNPVMDIQLSTLISDVGVRSVVDLNVYPNPASSVLTIESDSKINTIAIRTIKGDIVLFKNLYEKKADIDIDHLENGIYLLTTYSTEGISVSRIVVMD
jgi:hypothetical protein